MKVLVIGSTASGKSEFAEKTACNLCKGKKLYIATMLPFDEECNRKIAKHRNMRAKKNFDTSESPIDLNLLQSNINTTAMLECMSNLLANEMYRSDKKIIDVYSHIMKGINHASQMFENFIVVSNNVFECVKTYDDFTEEFIRYFGKINFKMAKDFDVVVEVVCGIPIFHKGRELINE